MRKCKLIIEKIIYLIFDYPHNYYTFKHFKIQENTYLSV